MSLSKEDLWVGTYGNLYRKLSCENGEIPIGLYRTVEKDKNRDNSVCVEIIIKFNLLNFKYFY
jgi:hypothetical protein